VMRAAKVNVRYHLNYIGWLARTRNYLAGDRLTYADLAAAAHLSAIVATPGIAGRPSAIKTGVVAAGLSAR